MMASIEEQANYIAAHIITQEQRDQAAIHVQNETDSKWASVRLSLDLQDKIGDELSKTAIREAVAKLYGVVGETIRRRERAGVVPVGIVEMWPGVSFSHWRTAVDYKGTNGMYEGDPLAAALDIMYQMDEYKEEFGELPSVATVDGWVYGDNGKVEMVWRSRSDSIVAQLDKVFHDKYTPFVYRGFIGWIKGMLVTFLDTGKDPRGGNEDMK